MYTPDWLRWYLAFLECNVVVLDAVWVCAQIDHTICRDLIASCLRKRKEIALRPREKSKRTEHCWHCYHVFSTWKYTCLSTRGEHIAQHHDLYYDVGHDRGSIVYAFYTPSRYGPLIHPGYWMQRALAIARS